MSYAYGYGGGNFGAYGYGGGGYGAGGAGGQHGYTGGGGGGDDYAGGNYNPRYHYQAAQNAGFELAPEDGMPKTLYVGNLDQSVTEDFISTLFGQIGNVVKTKVIFDNSAEPYAFVEFADYYTASQALTAMNRRMLMDREMKVNWATQPGTQQKIDTSKHFHVFVGDLSPEVDNKALKDAFSPFGEASDAKVIRDPTTLKSKGYGFISFPKREDAERAIEQMNGQWLGRRTIRTNWATRKPGAGGGLEPFSSGGGAHAGGGGGRPTLEEVAAQTGDSNTSVYIGGLGPMVTDVDIRNAFSKYGPIQNIRHFRPQGYAFVCYEKKDAACKAICEMNGESFLGNNIRCSWGKVDGGGGGSSTRTHYTPNYAAGGYAAGYGAGVNPMAGAYAAAGAAAGANMQQYWQYYNQYYGAGGAPGGGAAGGGYGGQQ